MRADFSEVAENMLKYYFDSVFRPHKNIFKREYRRWRTDNGEERRRRLDGLGPDSIVFDFGGFNGEWAAEIYERYRCSICIFEPHPIFAENLRMRFEGNEKISVQPFALGSGEGILKLSDAGDASSSMSGKAATVDGKIIEASSFMSKFSPQKIDLAKINIEGGEYDLLPALMDCGAISCFNILQIQFHAYGRSEISARQEIVDRLAATHRVDWCYPFIWEQWSKRL